MTLTAGRAACALHPTSRDVADLAEPFRGNVERFLEDLAARGCTVTIAATLRPEQRAWLMRQAWDLSHGLVTLAKVPKRADIDIAWSVAGAREMCETYQLRVRPSLSSRHIQGMAIDMRVDGWTGTTAALHALGKSFGVHKLVSDPPHWSSDGR